MKGLDCLTGFTLCSSLGNKEEKWGSQTYKCHFNCHCRQILVTVTGFPSVLASVGLVTDTLFCTGSVLFLTLGESPKSEMNV